MEAWLGETGHPQGAVLTFPRMWALVQPWYAGRLSGDWRGRSRAKVQAILDGVGLTGSFWRLD